MSSNSFRGNSKDTTCNMVRILARQKKGLSLCHINAQSLNNKIDEFRLVFEGSGIDVICVSETWFTQSTTDSLIRLNGYNVFRSDRVRHGGGVAIYIKNNIISKVRLKSCNEEKVEYIFVEIVSSGRKMLIGCIYRPNRNIHFDQFFTVLETLTVAYSDLLLAGDFNADILTDHHLCNHLLSLSLTPTNTTTPTHYSATTATLLDIFFVGNMNKVLLYDQISACCFSNHDLIFLSYDFLVPSVDYSFTYRDFKNINYNILYENFHQISWNEIFHMTSVDEQLSFIESNIIQLFDESVPIKTKKVVAKDKPWFTNAIKCLIQSRDLAYSRWKEFRTPELKEEYRVARNTVTFQTRNAKISYYSTRFGSALDSRQTWRVISDIGIGKENMKNKCQVDADELNQMFTSIPLIPVDVNNHNTTPNLSTELDTNLFEFSGVTQTEVFYALSQVKSNATGFDNINPRFIKILLPLILPFITHLFNSIITTSSFPIKWKYAKIIPLPKANSEFRPIAILSFLSKVLEKLLHQQMSKFVDENCLLSEKQSGFRANHSCVTALIDVAENIRRELDESKVNFLVLLDHSKAFDTVDHSTLCLKLKRFFNFSSSSSNLIWSYLSDRTQSVYVNNVISNPLPLTRGVPQGSILGPLLFSIYINDLPQQLSYSNIHLYADDVQLYLSSPVNTLRENIEKLNHDLNSVYRWATTNGLCLNPQKSKCLVIRKNSINPVISDGILLDNQNIEIVNSAKNLGIHFNSSLTWNNHINALVGQTYMKLRTLWSTQFFTPLKIRILLAKTYLIPGLIFGCELFSSCDAESRRKLNVLYNNIIRYVHGLKRYDHISPYSNSLYGVPFDSLLKIKTLILLHKTIYTRKPLYLFNELRFARSARGKQIIIKKHRYLVSEWQFHINAVRLWNNLPHNIQLTSNAKNFKKLLFNYYT